MDKQEATDFVIRELAKRRNRDDIITELCQRTGGTREQVQRFVQLVESQNRPTTRCPYLGNSQPRPCLPHALPVRLPRSRPRLHQQSAPRLSRLRIARLHLPRRQNRRCHHAREHGFCHQRAGQAPQSQ